MSVSERIVAIMSLKGLKQADMVRVTGYTGPAIKKITEDKSEPKFGFLKSIVDHFPDINGDWLLTGRGNMTVPATEKKDNTAVSNTYSLNDKIEIISLLKEKIQDLEKKVNGLEEEKKFKDSDVHRNS